MIEEKVADLKKKLADYVSLVVDMVKKSIQGLIEKDERILKDVLEEKEPMANDFEIEIGDKITVNLCSNPTTGFQWNYEMSGDNALKEEDHDFEEPDGDVVGASGIETWTFEGTAKGTTVVLMEYSQPWEGGIKKEWTYRITITVH